MVFSTAYLVETAKAARVTLLSLSCPLLTATHQTRRAHALKATLYRAQPTGCLPPTRPEPGAGKRAVILKASGIPGLFSSDHTTARDRDCKVKDLDP